MAHTVESGLSAVLAIIAFATLAWAAFGPAAGAAMAIATTCAIALQYGLLNKNIGVPKSRAPGVSGAARAIWQPMLLERGHGYV